MFKKYLLAALFCLALVAGCQNPTPTPPAATATASSVPATATPTPTPLPPTPTPVPLALTVNGEGISLAEFEAEIQRLQAALKETGKEQPAAEQKQQVLDELVEQTLLAQAAFQAGFKLEDAALQKRIDELAAGLGGAQALADWQKRNFYTDSMLRTALRRSMAAASMRDTIINAVPREAEQVHARQILVLDSATAERLFKQLEAGANFATLAFNIDSETGGDLGWFPKGYLLVPEVEAAAFALQPGKYSPIIKTSYGFHILQVIEHHQSRPLSVDAYRNMQLQALQSWLKTAREKSQIKILV